MASQTSRIPRRQPEFSGVSNKDDKTSVSQTSRIPRRIRITSVVVKENRDLVPARKSVRNSTPRKLSSVTGEVRRHLSVVDSNKPTSKSSSITDEVEDINISNLVFAEEEAGPHSKSPYQHKKVFDSRDSKTSKNPILKVYLPPATAILTSGPPDSATSTPPFPTTTLVISPASPATTGLAPDTKPCVLPANVVNIDLEFGLYEYSAEVVVYLRKLEQQFIQSEDYLENNKVTGVMRAILVDWLVQVQHYLKLGQETLHIAVRVLDTVLDRREVEASKLQLVGISALLVASKVEEYYQADIKKMLYLTENSYTKVEVLHMEMVLLEVVNFQVNFPTPQDFLHRYTQAALRGEDPEFLKTCQLLVDSNLPSTYNACLAPSLLAAAAIYTTSLLYNMSANPGPRPSYDLWTSTLQHYTEYTEGKMATVSVSMLDMFLSSTYTGARTKYRSNSQHGKLALAKHLQEPVVKRARQFLLTKG